MATMQFYDGTSTIAVKRADDGPTAAAGIGLMADGYAPAVARRMPGIFGGRTRHMDVDDEIRVRIIGSSSTDCLSRLHALHDMFDQATRWGKRRDVDPVLFQYQQEGSSTQVAAAIYDAYVITPNTFPRMGYNGRYRLEPVILRFKRRAYWLGATQNRTSAVSTGNPEIRTLSSAFSDTVTIPQPMDVIFRAEDSGSAYASATYPTRLIMVNDSGKLNYRDANDYSGFLYVWTAQAVTGAPGGYVLKSSPTVTAFGTQVALYDPSGTPPTGPGIYYAWVMLQNNSSTKTHTFRLSITTATESDRADVEVPVSSGPQYYFMGPLYADSQLTSFAAQAKISSSGSAGDELYLDNLILVFVDENTHIINMPDAYWDAYDNIGIYHRLNEYREPLLAQENDAATSRRYPGYEGNPVITMTGNQVSAIMLTHDDSGDWLLEDGADSEVDWQLDVTRTRAYLTPP